MEAEMSKHKEMKIASVRGRGIPVRGNDIDTDRIIPARYMKVVTFDGLGEYAFQDERYDQEGNRKEHPFNSDSYAGASILIVNKNFGCGSSREHAPQALHRWGINAVIGESFAEIFAGNCSAMGVPAVTAGTDDVEMLMAAAAETPEAEIVLDLVTMTVIVGDRKLDIAMPESSRSVLLNGTWDSTASLLTNRDLIERKAFELPYMNSF